MKDTKISFDNYITFDMIILYGLLNSSVLDLRRLNPVKNVVKLLSENSL